MGQLLGCRLCDALLFASLPLFPSLLWVRRLCDALLFHSLLLARRTCDALLFPSLLRAATRFSGTAFGLRPALAKSRRNGHAGTHTQRGDALPEPA